ncbi:MAG TPA: signal recognition particle-docking protein FtsY [Candidatus Corynebacterium gallistercoris]|uniref:Signal recognition particle receptor FtsY n=1 Tax=Candidatus Corynebacterium gallistercoris TaxID=2838530 RepID=A0A9D1UQB4_9CORY|nr:signal recognition particle-docking protein FtsY [Candidatus Corynebacterium gallistercoris]
MSNTVLWIIIGLVVLALIVTVIVAVGLKRSKAKQISFEKKEELEQKKPSSGDYQAQGGFNFTTGGAGRAAAEKEPVLREEPVATPEPLVTPEPESTPKPSATPEPAGEPVPEPEAVEEPAPIEEPKPVTEPVTEPEPTPEPVPEKPAAEPEVEVEEAEAQGGVAEEEPQPRDEIEPVQGRLGKLRGRMSKSQNVIGRGVLGILGAGDLDEDAWEEIEDTLLMADLGTATTMKVVDDLRERIAVNGVSSEAEARAMLRAALIDACKPELDRSIKAMPYEGKPAVIMVVGVNGTGKTTTTGKLSRVLVGMGHKVLLGAADTFRAAAADQLETWGRRVGADTVRGKEGADPASVAFDAVATGIDQGVDVVLVDTAGRLHTSVGLMDQLGKVKRVVEKKAKVDEVLLVLDATVGQNGLMQARTFREVVDITGVVLTKVDGTAKGGIVFQVQEELGVPVKLVGLGEGADHLAPFEVESFVDALLG